MSWTEERIETLKTMWAAGSSASDIAAELGGVTRNAVIGKIHRLGLGGKKRSSCFRVPKPKRPRSTGRYAPRSRFNAETIALQTAAVPKVDIPAPVIVGVGYFDRTDKQCSYSLDDNGIRGKVCGLPRETGKSFCDYHEQLSHSSQLRKRRSDAGTVSKFNPNF